MGRHQRVAPSKLADAVLAVGAAPLLGQLPVLQSEPLQLQLLGPLLLGPLLLGPLLLGPLLLGPLLLGPLLLGPLLLGPLLLGPLLLGPLLLGLGPLPLLPPGSFTLRPRRVARSVIR